MPRPSSQRRNLALFVIALGLVAFLLSLASCSQSAGDEKTTPDLPDIELRGNELTHYNEESKVAWVLRARSVQYFEESQQTQAQDVEVHLFDPAGTEALRVQADRLIFYHRTGDLEFQGNLQAHDPEGLRFSTDKAYWDEKARVLRSDSAVHLEREDLTLTGQGFEYHPDQGTLTIKSAHLKLILQEPQP
jgi:LPS export ABC transporter protein LptC